jgi:hypothetical protein
MEGTVMKWYFFWNGYAWWLKSTDIHQLEDYLARTDTDSFGGTMMNVAYRHMDKNSGDYENSLQQALDILYRNSEQDLLTTTGKFRLDAHRSYFRNLIEKGFVNINKLGGCNACAWPEHIKISRDELIFPSFTRKDVVIKTWQNTERQIAGYVDRYKYHYYAYIGGVQLMDGEKTKWDSKAECESFLDKLFADP